jgi:GxxExxY protein
MDGNSTTTERIIGCAIEVHKHLGPGLLESVYESALCIELRAHSIPFKQQAGILLYYKGELISEHRPDLIVNDEVIVEIKSVGPVSLCVGARAPPRLPRFMASGRRCRLRELE